MGGSSYVHFIRDDYSRYADAVLLLSKNEADENLRDWILHHETRLDVKLKFLRSDIGGEFTSADFEGWLYSRGVIHEKTVRDS
jgi:hypothetical protein